MFAKFFLIKGSQSGVSEMDRMLACQVRGLGFDPPVVQIFFYRAQGVWENFSRKPAVLKLFGVKALRKRNFKNAANKKITYT